MQWVISFMLAFAVSAILGVFLLPMLRRLKFGQQIREEGPKWHETKSGTPTMGGIMFILAFAICLLIMDRSADSLVVGLCAVLFGVIGFADDYIKVVKKRNLGLTALQKFLAQIVVAALFVVYLLYSGRIDTSIAVPFGGTFNLGVFFLPLAIIFMVGMVNGVNLTDGLDGLAGFVSFVVILFFSVAAVILKNIGVSITAIIAAGAILGFLVYNIHPAKVFMGDTGSLFIGGLLSALSVILGFELFFIVAGIIFIIETLSVIIQVTSFKLTGKRVFKMSPIHHHFEMCGFKENNIVLMFTVVTVIACIIAYLGI